MESLCAEGIPWQKPRYSFFAQNEPLAQLLKEFCAVQGIEIIVSDKVQGQVNGRFTNVPPQTFLDEISQAYGLLWVYDGSILRVYSGNEAQSEVIRLDDRDVWRVKRVLHQMGVVYSRSQVKSVPEEDIILVSGPPYLLEIFSSVINKLGLEIRPDQTVIRVFPLTYGWAYDLEFPLGREQIVIPGVATILNDLVLGRNQGGRGTSPRVTPFPSTRPKLGGTGLAAYNGEFVRIQESVPEGSREGTLASLSEDNVLVTADTRLNAVVIRDSEEKMSAYRKVIDDLDVEVPIVAIRVAIIDLDTNYSRNLGIQWMVEQQGHNTYRYGVNVPSTDNASLFFENGAQQIGTLINPPALAAGPGGNFTALIVNGGFKFLSKIQLLETEGYARILSQPSVVTLNNVQAVISRDQTEYIRVEGSLDVDLFDVNAGLTMRVTPNVIPQKEEKRNQIKLVISIEDGSLTATTVPAGVTVSSLPPPVRNNHLITTQAVILEGQSLLIGGIYREVRNNSETGVPLLRKIPILGYLFKEEQKNVSRMERLFLISPRVVELKRPPVEDVTGIFLGPESPVDAPASPATAADLGYNPVDSQRPPIHLGPIPSVEVQSKELWNGDEKRKNEKRIRSKPIRGAR